MILAIAGGSGSGKTTLAGLLANELLNRYNYRTVVISMDSYYKNINTHTFTNYDHPDAFDTCLLKADLKCFIKTKSINIRSYDFTTKASTISAKKNDIDIIIIEGLYPYYNEEIRILSKHKIYIDIDEKTRLLRRIKRDETVRNISEKENKLMINQFVKKMHKEYVSKQLHISNQIVSDDFNIDRIIKNVKTIKDSLS